ncbi:MAG TPA: Crp/Fnr family transcriptional regulator [Pyrinomonadaceae bacterium]|nr:Crp/Fnr family transcriptional regulator [Pyrinomonadaceae bacterium]
MNASYTQKQLNDDSLKSLLTNQLLKGLPEEDFARLWPDLSLVSLSAGENLYGLSEQIRFAYFPENAVASHLYILEDGSTTEAIMIGREGITGLSAVLGAQPAGHWTQVIVGGAALRVEIEVLRREFARGGALQQLLLGYSAERLRQLSWRAVCNGRHSVGERVHCWLLMIHDRVGDNELPLTHEQIARHLGTRRAGVSEVAQALRERGIIDYGRGHLQILDRAALEASACECYQSIGNGVGFRGHRSFV